MWSVPPSEPASGRTNIQVPSASVAALLYRAGHLANKARLWPACSELFALRRYCRFREPADQSNISHPYFSQLHRHGQQDDPSEVQTATKVWPSRRRSMRQICIINWIKLDSNCLVGRPQLFTSAKTSPPSRSRLPQRRRPPVALKDFGAARQSGPSIHTANCNAATMTHRRRRHSTSCAKCTPSLWLAVPDVG